MARGGSGGSGGGNDGFLGDVMDFLGGVMDFLGMGAASNAVDVIGDAVDMKQAMDAAGEVYDGALGSCGNEGQILLVEQIGPDSFKEAIMFGLENEGDCSGFLTDQTDHPEAIGEILEEAEGELNDILDGLMGGSDEADE